jgi:hypothetical protein
MVLLAILLAVYQLLKFWKAENVFFWVDLEHISKEVFLVECLFIEGPFHQSGFSSNGFKVKCTIVSNFQNCMQNFCSTSTSKIIDDLVHHIAFHAAKWLYWHPILT